MTQPAQFNCPNCGARYKVVRVAADSSLREITCRSCGGPLRASEGGYILKYFLIDRPKRRARGSASVAPALIASRNGHNMRPNTGRLNAIQSHFIPPYLSPVRIRSGLFSRSPSPAARFFGGTCAACASSYGSSEISFTVREINHSSLSRAAICSTRFTMLRRVLALEICMKAFASAKPSAVVRKLV
jgi:hypothetical protein